MYITRLFVSFLLHKNVLYMCSLQTSFLHNFSSAQETDILFKLRLEKEYSFSENHYR